MLRLITGRSGSGKTDQIFREIKNAADNGEAGIILLVPEQYSHEAEWMLSETCGDSISLHAEVLSFTRLSSRVFSEYGGIAQTYLDDSGKTVIMQTAMKLAEPVLTAYGKKSHQTDYIVSMLQTASECKSSGISPKDLLRAADKADGSLRSKLKDTAQILEIYYSHMQQDLHDPDEMLDFLSECLPATSYAHGVKIWVDGFRDFSAQEYRVLKNLLSVCADMTVSLTMDESPCQIFSAAQHTKEVLVQMAEDIGQMISLEPLSSKASRRHPEMVHLEHELFSDNPSYYGIGENIHVLQCQKVSDELEACAASITELVRRGVRYRDIAVAIGDFSDREYYCTHMLEEFGIPVYTNTKKDIRQMPAVIALESAIQVVSRGWDYDSVFSYLKTGCAGISEEECDKLENYAIIWNIHGKSWYAQDGWTMNPEGYINENGKQMHSSYLEELNEVRCRAVNPLVHLMQAFYKGETGKDRITALFDFADEIGLYEYLELKADCLRKQGDLRGADDCLNLGNILTKAAEQYYLAAGDLYCTVAEFASQWGLLLSRCTIGDIPDFLDRVTVGDICRIRRRGIKYLFVLGMTQNRIPSFREPGDIFSADEREMLLNLQVPISQSSDEMLCNSLTDAYELLTLPTEGLFMSYATDGENMPSQLVDTVCRMFHLKPETPDLELIKTTACKPCLTLAMADSGSPLSTASQIIMKNNTDYLHVQEVIQLMHSNQQSGLSEQVIAKLYGDKLVMTASRVNKFRECPFSYYMEYGLRVKKREQAELTPSVIGTFIHYVLEKTAKEIKNAGGFSQVDSEKCCSIAEKYIADYAESILKIPEEQGRLHFLFQAVVRDTLEIVKDMALELSVSDFSPVNFELAFPTEGQLPYYDLHDGPFSMNVGGIVDRVDAWENKGLLYLRVVDYKTGKKEFKLSEVFHGFDMQMLIYLFALQRFGTAFYGKAVKPAGILYMPAHNKFITVDADSDNEAIQQKKEKSHKRSGLILNSDDVIEAMEHGDEHPYLGLKKKDGLYIGSSLITEEQLEILHSHIDKILLHTCSEIMHGNISQTRLNHSGHEPCSYCLVSSICRPENLKVSYLKTLEPEKVWEELSDGTAKTDS